MAEARKPKTKNRKLKAELTEKTSFASQFLMVTLGMCCFLFIVRQIFCGLLKVSMNESL